MSEAHAQVTETHYELARILSLSDDYHKDAQLIADSEAAAIKTNDENKLCMEWPVLSNLRAERDQLRADLDKAKAIADARVLEQMNAVSALRAEVAGLISTMSCAEKIQRDWITRAERAETELAKERARLLHLFHHESPMAEPGDTLNEWLAQIDAAMKKGSQ